jgi:hypothetical protein
MTHWQYIRKAIWAAARKTVEPKKLAIGAVVTAGAFLWRVRWYGFTPATREQVATYAWPLVWGWTPVFMFFLAKTPFDWLKERDDDIARLKTQLSDKTDQAARVGRLRKYKEALVAARTTGIWLSSHSNSIKNEEWLLATSSMIEDFAGEQDAERFMQFRQGPNHHALVVERGAVAATASIRVEYLDELIRDVDQQLGADRFRTEG